MSYILDALKKSERERPPGPVPDLFTVHGPQPPLPRKPARAIVAALLLLVVLAISLLAWIGTGGREEGVTRPPLAASLPARVEAPAPPPAPRVASVPAQAPLRRSPDVPAPPPGAAAERSSVAVRRIPRQLPKTPVEPVRNSPEAGAATTVPARPKASPRVPAAAAPTAVLPMPPPVVATPPAPALIPPAEPPPPLAAPAASSVPAPVKETPAIVQSAAAFPPAEQAAAPEQDPPADGRVLNLVDLPAPVRAELPKLLVSGHVWSDEPGLRLLSVDDRLLHEGDEASPGVSLQEITQGGAIFVYKGWRFRVAGGRP